MKDDEWISLPRQDYERMQAMLTQQATTIAEQAMRLTQQATTISEQGNTITQLQEQVATMSQVVKDLQHRLSQDSHNSHLPPSSDRFGRPPRTHSLRERSGKKPGGQEGHQGHSLHLVQTPDTIQVH